MKKSLFEMVGSNRSWLLAFTLSALAASCGDPRSESPAEAGEGPQWSAEEPQSMSEGWKVAFDAEEFKADDGDGVAQPVTDVATLEAADLLGLQATHNGTEHLLTFTTPTARVRALKIGQIVASSDTRDAFLREILHLEYQGGGRTAATCERVWLWTEDVSVADTMSLLKVTRKFRLPSWSQDISGTELIKTSMGKVTCTDCTIRFEPTFEMMIDAGLGTLNEFSGVLDGALEGSLQITAESAGAEVLEKEITVASVNQRLMQNLAVAPVVIPIWEDVRMSIVVGVKGKVYGEAKVVTGIKASKGLKATMAYKNERWSLTHESPGSFTFEKPVLSTKLGAEATVYVKAVVELRVYSVAGAWLAPIASGTIRGKLCPSPATWNAIGEIGLEGGIGIDLLDTFKWEKKKQLYAKEWKTDGVIPTAEGFTCP